MQMTPSVRELEQTAAPRSSSRFEALCQRLRGRPTVSSRIHVQCGCGRCEILGTTGRGQPPETSRPAPSMGFSDGRTSGSLRAAAASWIPTAWWRRVQGVKRGDRGARCPGSYGPTRRLRRAGQCSCAAQFRPVMNYDSLQSILTAIHQRTV